MPLDSAKKTLVVGAGYAGQQLLRDINNDVKSEIFVVGFIDDDKAKINDDMHQPRYGANDHFLLPEGNKGHIFPALKRIAGSGNGFAELDIPDELADVFYKKPYSEDQNNRKNDIWNIAHSLSGFRPRWLQDLLFSQAAHRVLAFSQIPRDAHSAWG